MRPMWYIRFILYAWLVLVEKQQPTEAMAFMKKSVVSKKYDMDAFDHPQCTPGSICGFLQANDKGIFTKTLCTCPNDVECPMTWNSDDGFTVVDGIQQYKFCDTPPPLTECKPNNRAYTAELVYSKYSMQHLLRTEHMHCICPGDHTYSSVLQTFGVYDAQHDTMEITYTCVPLPYCYPGETCKTAYKIGPEFLINQKCRCGPGLNCPTVNNYAALTFNTTYGPMDALRCQP